MAGREIIDLKPEKDDAGRIVYESTGPAPKPGGFDLALKKITGIVFGLAVFAALLMFFVYIVLPLIAVILVVILLRKIYHSLIR